MYGDGQAQRLFIVHNLSRLAGDAVDGNLQFVGPNRRDATEHNRPIASFRHGFDDSVNR
ncbi:MAG: hypothetical protein ACLSUZ_02105 [Bifidobacterium pseudocatenulatum]